MTNQPPHSTLAENLAQAAAIKAKMLELLRELERTATGRPIDKPGLWRHDPTTWAAEHLNPQEPKTSSNPEPNSAKK